MSSINHSKENNESYFSIDTFFKQIGIVKIIRQVNFKRRTPINPTEFIKWLLTAIFARNLCIVLKKLPLSLLELFVIFWMMVALIGKSLSAFWLVR